MTLDDAIAALRRYSLIERGDDSLSVHRLLQMVARDRLPEGEQRKWGEAALRLVNAAFPFNSDDVRTWALCARLLPHALAAAETGESQELAPEDTSRLFNQVGIYFCGRAQYVEARQSYERALRVGEAAFGPTLATSRSTLTIWVVCCTTSAIWRGLGNATSARCGFRKPPSAPTIPLSL